MNLRVDDEEKEAMRPSYKITTWSDTINVKSSTIRNKINTVKL